MVCERLSLLRKAGPEECIEAHSVDAEFLEARCEFQPQHRREDVRRRRERRRWKREECFDASVHLCSGGKQAVVAHAGSSGDAVRNLPLHHHNGAGENTTRAGREETQQNLRSDVVGQVADHVSGLASGYERIELHSQHIGLDDLDVRLLAELKAQLSGEGAIDFNRDKTMTSRGKDRRNSAVAWANLDHGALAEWAERVHDGGASSVVNQEVLSEFGLARHVLVGAPFDAQAVPLQMID